MTPRQIKEMRDIAVAFASIIACATLVWLVFQFEAHKSSHKLTHKAFQEIIK